MDKIFEYILDKLKGADFWIALCGLAAGIICWKLIGTTDAHEIKLLHRQISIALVILLLAGGAIWVNHFFFLSGRRFSENLAGILVMRIVGDDAQNSLRKQLVWKLNSELQKEAVGERIEVHASDKSVDEEKNGLAAAHKRARTVGQRLNAKLVIWGGKSGDKKFDPRITVIAALKHWSAARERTHEMQVITDVGLPQELVDEPFYLIHFAAGYSHYIQENYKAALPHFEAALGRKGAFPKELPDLQFFTAACQCNVTFTSLYWGHSPDVNQESIAAKLQEALELFEKAASVYKAMDQTKWAVTQYNIGMLYGNLPTGDRAANRFKAIAAFDGAIRINPRNAQAYYDRGVHYQTEGDYDKAIADYGEAIRLNPKNVLAHNNRGAIYKTKGDYDKAIAAFDASILLNPGIADSYYNRGVAYQAKREYDRAIADYDEAIRLNPKKALAYNNRGVIYKTKGDYDKAISNYDEAIRVNPQCAEAYRNRGNAYQATGDHDKAMADYERASSL